MLQQQERATPLPFQAPHLDRCGIFAFSLLFKGGIWMVLRKHLASLWKIRISRLQWNTHLRGTHIFIHRGRAFHAAALVSTFTFPSRCGEFGDRGTLLDGFLRNFRVLPFYPDLFSKTCTAEKRRQSAFRAIFPLFRRHLLLRLDKTNLFFSRSTRRRPMPARTASHSPTCAARFPMQDHVFRRYNLGNLSLE